MPSKKRVQRNKEQWLVEFILKHGYVYGAELGVQKGINLKYLVNAINKFISNYNYQDVGKVRIITIRTLIKLVKLK